MSIFQAVKEQVTTREAAEYYGIQVKRNGMARCIFHDDRNPSMKLDRRYHCFGCQADGDVIDFVGKMFGLTPYEAASKLAVDFGICVPDQNACAASCKTEGSNTVMSTAEHSSEYDQEERQRKNQQDNQVQNFELRNRKEGEKKEQKKKKPEETEEQKKGTAYSPTGKTDPVLDRTSGNHFDSVSDLSGGVGKGISPCRTRE